MYAPPIIGIFGEQRSLALAALALQEQHGLAVVDVTRLHIIEVCLNFGAEMGFFSKELMAVKCSVFALANSRDSAFARYIQSHDPVLLSDVSSAEKTFASWINYRNPALPAIISNAISGYVACCIPALITGLENNKYSRNIIKSLGGEVLNIYQVQDKRYMDSLGGTCITHHDDCQMIDDVLDFYQSIFADKIKKMVRAA